MNDLTPPLQLRWAYRGAVALPAVYSDLVVTHRDDPWCLVGLHPLSGEEAWRVPGRFVWKRLGERVVGVRAVVRRGKTVRHDTIALDCRSGRVLQEERAAFWPLAFPAGSDWYVGAPLDASEGSVLSRVSLEPGGRDSWRATFRAKEFIQECAVGSRRVLAVVDDEVIALSAKRGRQLWRTSLGSVDAPAEWLAWSPELSGGLLIVSTDSGTAALDAGSGQIVWHQSIRGSRAAAGNQLYIHGRKPGASGTGHTLWSLDVRTGNVLMETDVSAFLEKVAEGNCFVGPPAVTDTHLFLADDCGTLWALERATGEPVWRHRPKGMLGYVGGTRPIIHENRLCITSFNMDPRPPAELYYEQSEGPSTVLEATGAANEPLGRSLPFEVERVLRRRRLTRRLPYHAARGEWTVLVCRVSEGSFFLAVRGKSRGRLAAPLDSGEGAIWVASVADGDALLTAFRKAFGSRSKASRARRVRAPGVLEVTVLKAAGKESDWLHTKWSGKEGTPESYVHWSETERRGEVREKDESYRRDLMDLLASLVLRE
jgi:hypothetical protein